ncbi:Na+/H+ antiporter NhaA [Sphingomonas sp.]|jgi:NhaA family Na+:H+ antiporter|uniref:Na+/H+ antiporter NhaA n=1 Tax=Sphingomonas sp. TaxID=28214 RepID=UPI002D7E1A90|nr:Na+/H+ antiporter NhaA [Sphingomonas sp.]HEU0045552.1 Na+/H+ antiporter NhaA [Sphingomonas sp.]
MIRRPISVLRTLLSSEATAGLMLMASAALALVVANSFVAPAYFAALHVSVAGLSVEHWVNDGLMALFFLLVGLEIKRELIDGQLSTWRRRALPGIAAIGGMVVPAAIFVALNAGEPATLRGWAIPTATDIAFALGVLALLGRRVPVSLKIFLTALAIIDDLGAVAIIALFYTADLALGWLLLGAAAVAVGYLLNRRGVVRLAPYLLLGAVLWVLVLRSGVHPTLAGVALALVVPLRASPGRPDDGASPLHRLEHALQPWVAYLVLPVFGFANAGVALGGVGPGVLSAPLPLGVAAGLFFGKQLGVFGASWAAIRLRLAPPPDGASMRQLYGVALLCGVGFTMSLFIGALAFRHDPELLAEVKIAVLAGSALSALAGAAVMLAPRRKRPTAR